MGQPNQPEHPVRFRRRQLAGRFLMLRLGLLVVLLVAVLVLHVSGSTLVVIRIARIVLVALVLVTLALIRRRRGGMR